MEALALSASCFICGGASLNRSSGAGGGGLRSQGRNKNRRSSLKGLKELVRRLCELLRVEVTLDDWEYLEVLEVEQKTELLCCEKCFEILKNVDKVHEVILKAQEELKAYLDDVQSMIVQSESKSLQSSFWWKGCFDFRKSILKKFAIHPHTDQSPSKSHVKEEGDQANPFLDDHDHHEDLPIDDNLQEQEPLSSGPGVCVQQTQTGTTVESSENRLRRKRKIKVVADEDEFLPEISKSSKRASKIRAEETLKIQCIPNEASDNDDDKDETNDATYQDDSYHGSGDDADGDEGGTMLATKENRTKANHPRKRKATKLVDGDADDNSDRGPRPLQRKAPPKPFYPFIIFEENLLLYRYDTFIKKTFTYLHCQAYKCDFSTEFDYFADFASFQRMREHVETCHNKQQTPHPCLLCKISLKNQESFTNHLKTKHSSIIYKNAQGICECCLRTKPSNTVRIHLFSHKNAEEKQAAIDANDVPAICLKPKESEITERPFKCEHPGCPMACKTLNNLKRHQQKHLPKEIRTTRTICPECGINLMKQDLKLHLEKFHHPETVDRSIICRYCDKRFHQKDKSNYKSHMRRHKGERPFLCTECGRSFFEVGDLNVHIKHSHTKSEGVCCQWCGKFYAKPLSLKSHLARYHPDKYTGKSRVSQFYEKGEEQEGVFGPVQMFPCEWCEEYFEDRSTVKRHLIDKHGAGGKARSGPGIFPCEFCDAVCGYEYTLKKHKRNKHGIRAKRTQVVDMEKGEKGATGSPALEEEEGYQEDVDQYGSESGGSSLWS